MTQLWNVEKSHRVRLPKAFKVVTLDELKLKLQHMADSYRATEEHPALGELSYRYELDDKTHEITGIHAYFINKHGDKNRFARLRRQNDENA